MNEPEELVVAWARAYGGLRAVARSLYLWIAVLFSGPSFLAMGREETVKQSVELLPNLLGFTLAGYAMLLAFGNESFQRMLARAGSVDKRSGKPAPSVYLRTSAAFFWFVFVQAIALFGSLVLPPFLKFLHVPSWIISTTCLTCWVLTLYAILLSMEVIWRVFELSKWFNLFAQNPPAPPSQDGAPSNAGEAATEPPPRS